MSKKKEKNDFRWFSSEAKNVDLASKEKKEKLDQELKEEKPGKKLTGRDKFPPLPNGFSSNRPH